MRERVSALSSKNELPSGNCKKAGDVLLNALPMGVNDPDLRSMNPRICTQYAGVMIPPNLLWQRTGNENIGRYVMKSDWKSMRHVYCRQKWPGVEAGARTLLINVPLMLALFPATS